MSDKSYVYALVDPRNDKIRYIGISCDCEKRLKQHIKESKAGEKNHRCNWIRSLLSNGSYPILKIIEETSIENRNIRERYWIKYYGRENLVNGTDGGEGKLGAITSEDTKAYFSKLFSGEGNPFYGRSHTEETLERLRNRKMSEESKMKNRLSKLGKKLTDEHKEKIRLGLLRNPPFKGRKHSDEAKNQNRIKHLGKPSPFKGTKTGIPSPYRNAKREGRTSTYIGVSKKGNRFSGRVTVGDTRMFLCDSKRDLDVAIAYDIGATYYYGEKANLNFKDCKDKYVLHLKYEMPENIEQLRCSIKKYLMENRRNDG